MSQQDKTPKPEGTGFAIVKTTEGLYSVVQLKLKGKQVLEYEVIHADTSRGDAKRQLTVALQKHYFNNPD